MAVFIGAALLMVGACSGSDVWSVRRSPRREAAALQAGSDAVIGFGQSNVRYYVYALLS